MSGGARKDIFGPTSAPDTITGFDANPAGGQHFLNVHDLGITAATSWRTSRSKSSAPTR